MSDFQQKALKHLGLDSTNPNFSITDSDIWDLSNIQAGYNICQKEYEEKLRWIPIEKETPKNTRPVLCKCVVNGRIEYLVSKYYKSGWQFNVYYSKVIIVTHWRSFL